MSISYPIRIPEGLAVGDVVAWECIPRVDPKTREATGEPRHFLVTALYEDGVFDIVPTDKPLTRPLILKDTV